MLSPTKKILKTSALKWPLLKSTGTREFSNSICLCSQNSESFGFSDAISVLLSSIPHPTSEHVNPLGDHSVLCSNDVSFI